MQNSQIATTFCAIFWYYQLESTRRMIFICWLLKPFLKFRAVWYNDVWHDGWFIAGTPLWRNGPPEKPVLCNACGSRWRTKGTLANYTPLHARIDPDDYEDQRAGRIKTISLKKRDDKLSKRKFDSNRVDEGSPDYSQGFQKHIDEDTSNRSSSGSAISNSESCAQLGSADASEMTGQRFSCILVLAQVEGCCLILVFLLNLIACWFEWRMRLNDKYDCECLLNLRPIWLRVEFNVAISMIGVGWCLEVRTILKATCYKWTYRGKCWYNWWFAM